MYRDNSSGKRHNFWGTKKSTSGAGPANRSSREKDSPERICNEIWVSLFGNLKNHWQVLTFQFLTKKKCKFCVLRISQQVLFFRKLSADDARVLVSTALQGNVHRQYAQAFGGYYIVTTCRDRSFYGKNVDTSKKNGIVIIRLKRIFIIARYDVPETSFEFIPTLELFADKLAEFGYWHAC